MNLEEFEKYLESSEPEELAQMFRVCEELHHGAGIIAEDSVMRVWALRIFNNDTMSALLETSNTVYRHLARLHMYNFYSKVFPVVLKF